MTSKKLIVAKTNFIRPSIKFGLAVGILVAFVGFSIIGTKAYYRGKIYPFIKIAGLPIGGKKIDTVFSDLKIKLGVDQPITFKYQLQEFRAQLFDAGVKINLEEAILKAYQVGRGGVWQKNILPTIVIDQSKLDKKLSDNLPLIKVPQTDAKFSLNKDQLTIEVSKAGLGFDLPLVSKQIETTFQTGKLHEITVTTREIQPQLSEETLTNIKPSVLDFINYQPQIMVSNKKFTPSKDGMLSFVLVNITDGIPVVSINPESVSKYIEDLTNKTTVAAKPDIYFDSGELSQTGRDGLTIDQDLAVQKITDGLNNRTTSPIILATTSLPKTKKIIEKPFTPGLYEGKYIEVDLSSQTLYQFEGSNLVGTRRVSTGKWSMPTPTGTFSINDKNPRAYSSTYNLYMPYWMSFIGSKYGLHELPEWPDGRKEGASHIGIPVSHGCIRLGVGDAGAVYDWADVGTIVYIHK